jgi:hypothetical protein
MSTRLIIPALLGALALSAPAMAAANQGHEGAAQASANRTVVSFVDSGRDLNRNAWTPPDTAAQAFGRSARLPGDYRTRQAAEVAAAVRCREFGTMFDEVSPKAPANAETAEAKQLRNQAGALCAAGKDARGLAKVETALHDLLGATPAA